MINLSHPEIPKVIQKCANPKIKFLILAKKYLVRPLINHCETFLHDNLSAENVFTVLQYTMDCEADIKLTTKCAEVISAKTKEVLKSEEFLKISSKCLEFLLEQNSLAASEAELFNSVCSLNFLIVKNSNTRIH